MSSDVCPSTNGESRTQSIMLSYREQAGKNEWTWYVSQNHLGAVSYWGTASTLARALTDAALRLDPPMVIIVLQQ